MGHFAITVIGSDRTGIVAGITEALRDVGGNLEDVSSTILRGHFTMVFVVAAPGVAAGEVEETLRRAAEPLGVTVTVRDVEGGVPNRPQATHVFTAYGSDKPGIVARFTRVLADRGINITDLSCRLVGEEKPVYAMIAEIELPEEADPGSLEAALKETAVAMGVDMTLRTVEVETL
jgi:glycine cleavage system transcriptional repressor